MVAEGDASGPELNQATDHLDAYLAATQLGITPPPLASAGSASRRSRT